MKSHRTVLVPGQKIGEGDHSNPPQFSDNSENYDA